MRSATTQLRCESPEKLEFSIFSLTGRAGLHLAPAKRRNTP